MDSKERLKILENMLKTMTAEELDDFIYDVWYESTDVSYDGAFEEAVKQRS